MPSAYEASIERALSLLAAARSAEGDTELVELAVELAAALLEASRAGAESHERERAARTAALLDDPVGQAFVSALTDRAHRSSSGERLLEQVRGLVRALGVPRSFTHWDRLELRALRVFGSRIPELTARAVRRRIDEEAAPYLAPADAAGLEAFLLERRGSGMTVNVNHLGEEVLGQEAASQMLAKYQELLGRSGVDTISVKLSSIDSRIDLTAWEQSLSRLTEKLGRVYGAALGRAADERGGQAKLVYLDMEAFRDLELTVEVFCRVLSEPAYKGLTAGIVLQAYLPDSHRYQQRLIDWARARVESGGAPIRMRLVKGANLMMERIESELVGLELPVYGSKHDVDASFKRMLRAGTEPENARVVQLGVGSHNLFDIAYTLVLRAHHDLGELVEPEMLEGMADPLRRVIARVAGRVLVYAPSVDARDFPAAVAYLVRRLDENTSEENFLRHSFAMGPGDQSFADQRERFVRAAEAARNVSIDSRRRQDRSRESGEAERADFDNDSDTDFARPENRAWLAKALRDADRHHGTLASRFGGKAGDGRVIPGFDPSRPGHEPYQVRALGRQGVEAAIAAVHAATPGFSALAPERREAMLLGVAAGIRRARGELVAAMVLDAGKRAQEADVEVSEAADFAEYYARQHARLRERFTLEPKGLTVVTPPWNFPLSIGLGGVLSALVAGNTVLLKPPPETPLVLSRAAELCWAAGVPEDALGLVLTEDSSAEPLIVDERVRVVVLTGGSETARFFRKLRPELDLVAETGGKNALIVSAMSDREQAIKHAVRSAFGHSGQKCSALSVLILEREVYRSAAFRARLVDAVRSLPVGSAWNTENQITPLIRPPDGALARALGELREGESWLVAPERRADNERLVSPGVLLGVEPGSFVHQTELFGPVLAVLEARDFEHALELANGTPYGLTAGLESLDTREQELFLERMDAGNLYVNRPTTGAVVGRQPFGGRKASSFGPGFKAGGPNTLLSLVRVTGERPRRTVGVPLSLGPRRPPEQDLSARLEPPDSGLLAELIDERLENAPRELGQALVKRLRSYERAFREELSAVHPQDRVLGYEDLFVYQPIRVAVVAFSGTSELDLLSTLVAAEWVGARVSLYLTSALAGGLFQRLPEVFRFESPDELAGPLAAGGFARIRVVAPEHEQGALLSRFASLAPSVEVGEVSEVGYVELRRYVVEQSRSIAQHRYGNMSLAWAREAVRKSRREPA